MSDDPFLSDEEFEALNKEALERKVTAFTKYRNVFFPVEKSDGPWVLTHLLQMLGLWETAFTDESRIRRNVATEILEVMGIGRFEDQMDLVEAILRNPVLPPGSKKQEEAP